MDYRTGTSIDLAVSVVALCLPWLVDFNMASVKLVPLDRPSVAPLTISGRLRSQLVYFMTAEGAPGVPALGEQEFFFAKSEVETWLDEGVIYLVSPLDTANYTEVELSEEQEAFLNWLKTQQVQHVKVAD